MFHQVCNVSPNAAAQVILSFPTGAKERAYLFLLTVFIISHNNVF